MNPSFENNDQNTWQFALWLCAEGIVGPELAYVACMKRLHEKPRLGVLAVVHGMLSLQQSAQILSLQSRNQQLYGEAAMELGFLTEQQLQDLLSLQQQSTPTLIETLCRSSDEVDAQVLLQALIQYLNSGHDVDLVLSKTCSHSA